ncbi:MAG: cyclic nucleotide-binding domain-containing protein [Verrucomicrobia bacterium]|nr:cyclic nucleotide-binding domain-containing protein [Verrucomicrobiota bacterium]
MVALEQSKLFSSLSSTECRPLYNVTQLKRFSAGTPIFIEGDQGDGLYVVRSGIVQISARVNQGERRRLGRIGTGDFFGEMAVIDSEPRSATATAEVETELYFIPSAAVLEMLQRSPKFAISLVKLISLRIREANRQYIQEVLTAERLTLVGRFARSIVHDFKNPLSVIGFAAEMLDADHAAPAARKLAKTRIRKQVDRLNSMIKEILEFTRPSQIPIVLASVDFSLYMSQLLEDLQAELTAASIELCCENPPPSVTIRMEPDRLTHVFFNVIHNAVQAMPEGGKIFIRFATDAATLRIEIEDTGHGISPEIAPRLFEPFATHGKVQGTGLGLSICKKIIEDHRGEIRAQTEPGRGAIFAITLPRMA